MWTFRKHSWEAVLLEMFGQIGFGLQLGRLAPLGPNNMPAVSLSLSSHGNEEFKTEWCVPSTLSTER